MRAKNNNKIKSLIIGSFILIITISLNYNSNLFTAKQTNSNIKNDKNNKLNLSSLDVNGKPLLIKQYSTVTNSFFPSSLPTNASFTLFNDWISQNVNIKYEGVSQKLQRVSNGGFTANSTGWLYKSNTPTEYISSYRSDIGNPLGCVQIKLDNGPKYTGDYGYYEQNITIPEKISSGLISRLSLDYYLYGAQPSNVSVYLAVIMDNVEKNITYDFKTYLVLGGALFSALSMNYDPSVLGQIGPGNATIRVGIYTDGPTSLAPFAEIRFDNVKFELWTMPNETNLVRVFDNEFGANYTYINSSYGKGYTFIDLERTREPTNDVTFTIFSNKTDVLDFFVYNITIYSSLVRNFNTTISGLEGSKYSFGESIIWETNINFSEYYKYGEIWAEILKPMDWNINHVYDRDNIDRIGNCFGTGLGINKTTIPIGVMTPSNIERPWKIVANSVNYIINASLSLWVDSTFKQETKITIGDTFRINVILNSSISFLNTQVNCTILYPNGTIYWKGSKIPYSTNLNFGNFTAGNNMTIGEYQVLVEWINNQTFLLSDKAGYKEFNFIAWHHTNLTAVDSYIEKLVGDPLLIKVNFRDYDFNSIIEFASVNFSSSFGQSGEMIYLGSGIYFAEIDTSLLDLGDYYFSFSAFKSFYENQTIINLIQLSIVPQSLALSLSKSVIETTANNIASCQVNVSGAITKTLLWPINISTDWFNPYNMTDHNNGTVTLDFSTIDIPTQGYLESYTIEIFVNKTGYGNANEFLTLLVHPIPAIAKVNNSLISLYQDEIVIVKANYTDYNTGELIVGANCDISWQGSYLINTISNEFEISLNTTGLAVDYYNALITFTRAGYETAFKIVTVIINEREVNMSVFINSIAVNENFLIEGYFQQQINISARVFTTIGGIYLSGGTITWLSENYQTILNEAPPTYFNTSIILDGAYFKNGINTIFLRFQKTNYTTKIFAFQLYIRAQAIDLTVQINYQNIPENHLIEYYYNQNFQLSCRAYAEIEAIFLSGGIITFVNNEHEIVIPEVADYWFNSSIIISSNIFSLGLNNVYLRFEQSNYSTTIFTFKLYIREQAIDLIVQIDHQEIPENHLVEIYFNQNFQLSCRAYAEIDTTFLTGGILTFVINDYEIIIPEIEDFWFISSIFISSNFFSLGSNNVYLRFEQLNYTTTVFAFQILVKQIKINVETINFQDSLEGIEGSTLTIQLRLTQEFSSEIIDNATIFYSWNFRTGYFNYISNGTYELRLNLPTGYSGNYPLRLIISTENLIYESQEYSIIITITQRETPNYLMWVLIGSLAIAIGTLGIFSLRTYVLLPRKRKKEAELLDKIQVYKDVKNIQALMLIQKNSGLPIYTQEIRIFESDDDSFLVSGFIQAITNFSEVLIQREFTKYKNLKTRNEYTRYTIELDFNIFQLLVCDYGNLRVLIFLREKSSERLKKQLYFLTLALNSQYSEEFAKFTGDISSIRFEIEYLINQFLFVHYIGTFIITEDKSYVEAILNSGELTKLEMRLFNVILSITKEKKEFNLQNPLELIQEKDEDAVLKALDTLINKKLIISTYSAGLKLKK